MNGIAEMFLSTFCFSVMTLSVKLSSMTTTSIIFHRSLVQFFFTFISIFYRKLNLGRQQIPILIARGLVGAIEIGLFYYSVQNLKLEDATIIFLSSPILTTILSYFILGEPINTRNILSLVLCISGALLVAAPQFRLDKMSLGVIAALGGAITSSFVYIIIKCLDSHALFSIFSFNFFSIVLAGIELLITQSWAFPKDPYLILIIISSYFGQYYLNTALQKIPASTGTLIVNLDVVFAFFYSIVFFGNGIALNSCIGAIFVIIGSIISSTSYPENNDEEEAPLLNK
eukprot:NODE_44_length_33449_cov_1.575742.p17 type:complete len:286 gc:universal NODE_44_length_33449_cov_1.575742:14256-13399(-)